MDIFQRTLDDADLVFFDLETTGLDAPGGDMICEIGAIKLRRGEEPQVYQTVVNPGRPIPSSASSIHGISDDDVRGAPFFQDVIDKFMYFLGNSVLCGYNIGFDIGFLDRQLAAIQYPPIEFPCIDIMLMARSTINSPKYSLEAVARVLDIRVEAFHRALEDARCTKDIFLALHPACKEKGVNTVGDFVSLYGLDNAFFYKQHHEKINRIKKSMLEKSALRIRYMSRDNTPRTLTVFPQELTDTNARATFAAQNAQRTKTYTFCVSRVLTIENV